MIHRQIDRPSLHGKHACLLWVWVLLVRVADHAPQREAEQSVAAWDACIWLMGSTGAASQYGLMMPIAKATSHSFLPFTIGILASFLLIICVIMVWFHSHCSWELKQCVCIADRTRRPQSLCLCAVVCTNTKPNPPPFNFHLFYRTSISKFLFIPMRSLPFPCLSLHHCLTSH